MGRFGRCGRFAHFQKIPKSEGGSKPIFGVRPGGVRAGEMEKNDLKRVDLWKSVEEKYPCVEM